MSANDVFQAGSAWVITAETDAVVTDAAGLNKSIKAGEQAFYYATGTAVTVESGRVSFSKLPAGGPCAPGGSGGEAVTIDPSPAQGSNNAVSSGGVYTALRTLPAPLPTALTPTTAMKNGGVYTVTANATAQEYTAITLADNATAEIWLTCTSDDNSVALPGSTQGWIWLDPMPDMEAGKTYAVAARNVGNAVLARPIYEYTTPAQS